MRLYRPGDEGALADLLEATFPRWPNIETSVPVSDHMLWKLSSDPESASFQVVAEVDRQIVGCRLFWLTWFRIHGDRLRCRQGFDLAVHPHYRGRGILNEMWSYARRHFDDLNDFNFGVGAHPATMHMRVAQGNIVIGNKVQVLACADTTHVVVPHHDIAVREVPAFDGRVDGLFTAAAPQFDFIRERTSVYLNWRFADRRAGMFSVLQADAAGEMLGYVALSCKGKTGVIVDLLALPDRLDVVEVLVSEAIQRFATIGCQAVECWIPTVHPYRTVMLGLRFAHKKRGIHLSYRSLRAPASKLEFLADRKASVHIMAADTDLV